MPPLPQHHRPRQGQRPQQLLLSPVPDLSGVLGRVRTLGGAARRCPRVSPNRGFRPARLIVRVFLKSLTLKGFKSFADPTTLEFEPGVTVVVGPNGSGKSNVVDAVAWVLGAQGPSTVRSAKMEDVIFAGTPSRPALGRAEVSLTIDNSAGLLPIEFSEVTITRTLFRTGRIGVRHQPGALPLARHPGVAVRHRGRSPAARDRVAGQPGRHPQLPAGGPSPGHRGGGGHPEVPPPQGAFRAPAASRPRPVWSGCRICSGRCVASCARSRSRPRPPGGTATWQDELAAVRRYLLGRDLAPSRADWPRPTVTELS